MSSGGTLALFGAAKFFVTTVAELSVLFIGISFLIALLQELLPPEKVQKILSGQRSIVGNLLGAALGAITPFCSCSTVPIAAGLLRTEVPFGTVASFLVSSPLLNPAILTLFTVFLGIRVTLIYFAVTFVGAVISGEVWTVMGMVKEVRKVRVVVDHPQDDEEPEPAWKKALRSSVGLFMTSLKAILIGTAIGAFIYGFVPEAFITKVAGKSNPFAIPIAAIIGVPMYIRAETMIPLAKVLTSKGMSLGAVIALIVGGAGASIPETVLLSSLFKKRLIIAFLTTVFLVATAVGLLVELAI